MIGGQAMKTKLITLAAAVVAFAVMYIMAAVVIIPLMLLFVYM